MTDADHLLGADNPQLVLTAALLVLYEKHENLALLLDGPVRRALTAATEDGERLDAFAVYLTEHGQVGLHRTEWEEGVTVEIGAHSDEPRPTTADALRATLDQIRAALAPAAPAPENAP